jgi:hypothetical protein
MDTAPFQDNTNIVYCLVLCNTKYLFFSQNHFRRFNELIVGRNFAKTLNRVSRWRKLILCFIIDATLQVKVAC